MTTDDSAVERCKGSIAMDGAPIITNANVERAHAEKRTINQIATSMSST